MTPEDFVIVESHHQVLSAWAKYRTNLGQAPRLLTLDHHTDTSKPFRNFINKMHPRPADGGDSLRARWLSEIQYSSEDSIQTAISRLGNDEHIVTAIATDIVSAALVVAHKAKNTDLATFRHHKIICYDVDRKPNSKGIERSDCDAVLESEFLKGAISGFDAILGAAGESAALQVPYILDIDLDYLNTLKSVQPRDSSFIQKLAHGAGLVTIATEPEYVKNCAIDSEIDSGLLLSELISLLCGHQ